jgi:FdhE protein
MPSVTKLSPWQRRIHRAVELSRQYPAAAEILGFYVHVAEFQQEWHRRVSLRLQSSSALADASLSEAELAELLPGFDSFLSMAKERGPAALAERIRELRAHGQSSALLAGAWKAASQSNAEGFLAQAFLQPYAELLRSRATLRPSPTTYALCPFCNRKPSFGVLRQMGDGSARSLICSFCLAEWEFRRLVCPGCGEENDKKLPIFTADEFDYIRVECCDTCKTFIKTVDLTKNGRAEPVVDELASAPLDLWAREHGYAKLRSNLMGM